MITKSSSPDQIIREGFSQLPQFVAPELQGRVRDELGKVQSYQALVSTLEETSGMDKEDAEYTAGSMVYGLLEKAGIDPYQWKFTVSPLDLKSLKYGPEEYENARRYYATWTQVAEISLLLASVSALVTAGIAAFLAGSTLKQAMTAIRAGKGLGSLSTIWNIAKFKGIKWLAIPAAITTISSAVAFFANTQLTSTGDLVGYLQQGVARGAEMEAKAALAAAGGGSLTSDLPKTIIRMTEESKPKQFIGTLFSSKLGKVEYFDRQLDDKITDMNDLEADVKVNLNRWLQGLPGRMGFSVATRKDPVDETGAQQSGIWATLTIFIQHISGKITPIDTILLGPVEPAVRLEIAKSTKTIENQVSGIVSAMQVKEIQVPGGFVDIFDTKGNKTTVSGTFTTPTTPAIPTTSATNSGRKLFIETAPGVRINTQFASQDIIDAADKGIYKYVDDQSTGNNTQSQTGGGNTGQTGANTTGQTAVVAGPPKRGDRYFVANTGGEGLRLRGSPGLNSQVLFNMKDGTLVEFMADEGSRDGYSWWEVKRVSDGSNGSVASQFLVKA